MNYTPNHHLPQWVKSDPIRMDDFNNAMANIEAGLDAAGTSGDTQSAIASAISKADAAQSTADSALSKANAAQSAANAAREDAAALPYVTGSYVGKNAAQTIGLGFQPSFVIVSGMSGSKTADSCEHMLYSAMTGGHRLTDRIQLTGAGFMVLGAFEGANQYPNLNAEGVTYDYIAFK